MVPRITGDELIGKGHFLTFRELQYRDDRGRERKWETVDRNGDGAAVFIVATTTPGDELILVRQFRPPAGRLMLEFPAGLIDAGEAPEETARRELYEETGFEGRILHLCRPGYSSPGLTGESITLARMEIDGTKFADGLPQNAPEDTESIEVFRVPETHLAAFIRDQEAQGVGIDTKLYVWLAARNQL